MKFKSEHFFGYLGGKGMWLKGKTELDCNKNVNSKGLLAKRKLQ